MRRTSTYILSTCNQRVKGACRTLLLMAVLGAVMHAPAGTAISAGAAAQSVQEEATEQPQTETDQVLLRVASKANQMHSLDKFSNSGSGCDDTGYLWGDPLVSNDHEGNYSPALATEWSMSLDGLRWTFRLRQDVQFHDGSNMTSEDVKLTYERLLDPALEYTNSWTALDHVETPDEYTAVICLNSEMPTFLDEVGFVPVICAEAYRRQPEDFFLKPVGTGAYRVDSFDPETGEADFIRNENWWGSGSGNVDIIRYMCVSDDIERAQMLENGEADIVTVLTPDYYDLLGDRFELVDIISDSHIHLGFRCGEGDVFADYDLRAALSMCIDRQMLCNSILGGGAASTWPVGENILGYVDGYEYVHDMEKARQLVAGSGYDGREVTLIYTSSTLPRADEVAQTIQTRASEIGINLILEPLSDPEFQRRRAEGAYDVTLASFAATCSDPQTEVAVILANDVFNTGCQDEQFRELCAGTRKLIDREERRQALEEIFLMEMENLQPFVYLYSPEEVFAMAENISNIIIYKDYSADYRFVVKQ